MAEAITPEGMTQLKTELEALEGEGRRTIAQRILVARELGDLSENAEYHAAKEEQGHLETRIARRPEHVGERMVPVRLAALDTTPQLALTGHEPLAEHTLAAVLAEAKGGAYEV